MVGAVSLVAVLVTVPVRVILISTIATFVLSTVLPDEVQGSGGGGTYAVRVQMDPSTRQ